MKLLKINDEELALLDGKCREELQPEVDKAKARLAAANLYALPVPIAGLIADVVSEAQEHGFVLYRKMRARHCSLCGKSAGYPTFKSGPRRGKSNYDRPLSIAGIEFAYRFVTVDMHIVVGGCEECVARAVPFIQDALFNVRAEVPPILSREGRPAWKKYDMRHCTKCDWKGHEGLMGTSPTMMGDGRYPSTCPNCGAENRAFGKSIVEYVHGEFEVVDETPASTKAETS